MENKVLNGFEPLKESGWRLGFGNLFRRESRKWWGTHRWWTQAGLWNVILVGLLVMVLFVLPNLATPAGDPALAENPSRAAVQGFFSVGAVALAIGITILMQDEVIGEKQSGTAEWVLSKPAARSAFLLAKLAAHSLGALIFMVAIPSAIAFAILWLEGGRDFASGSFLAGASLVALHTVFYLALTLMLGVFASQRGAVLAVSLGSLLGGSVVRNLVPATSLVTPWFLPDIAGLVGMGQPLPTELVVPVIATAVWTLVFVGAALWRFQGHEF